MLLLSFLGLQSILDPTTDVTPAPIYVGNITDEPLIDIFGNLYTTTTAEPDFIPTTGSTITIPTVSFPDIEIAELQEPNVTCDGCSAIAKALQPKDESDAESQASQAKLLLGQIMAMAGKTE